MKTMIVQVGRSCQYGPYAAERGGFTQCSLTAISALTHNFCVIRFAYYVGVAKTGTSANHDLQFAFQARKYFFTTQSKASLQ